VALNDGHKPERRYFQHDEIPKCQKLCNENWHQIPNKMCPHLLPTVFDAAGTNELSNNCMQAASTQVVTLDPITPNSCGPEGSIRNCPVLLNFANAE
jgi:hypothetical protein